MFSTVFEKHKNNIRQKLNRADGCPISRVQALVESFKGKPEGTYDFKSGKRKILHDGFCVSFHQNEADENGNYKSHMGRYTPEDYGLLTNQLREKYGVEVNVGVFDHEPEISFHTKSMKTAFEIMVAYNQHSIYDVKRGKIIRNFLYDRRKNPMKGKDNEQAFGNILGFGQGLATSSYAG